MPYNTRVVRSKSITGPVSYTHLDVYKRQVQVTSDGQPGADPTVRIRGVGSFGDTSPLYVIDGVPMGTSCLLYTSRCV